MSSGPHLDFLPKPEARTARAHIDHWARHVVVAPEIGADAVGMGQTQEIGDKVSVYEILGPYRGHHPLSLNRLTISWESYSLIL
jgi:sugar phosphate isomerase/epimerase